MDLGIRVAPRKVTAPIPAELFRKDRRDIFLLIDLRFDNDGIKFKQYCRAKSKKTGAGPVFKNDMYFRLVANPGYFL
jgi:hypothetical protein